MRRQGQAALGGRGLVIAAMAGYNTVCEVLEAQVHVVLVPRVRPRREQAIRAQREMDVLSLLSTGSTNAEIAQRLVVSVRTVDHHVSALLQKLGVSSRRDATEAARSLGLISDPT